MKSIHVLRKPCSEPTVAANVLRHGTGALNVDVCRVAYAAGEVDFDRVQRQQHSEGAVTGAFGAAALVGKVIPTYKPGGRWPANLLLQHTEGCSKEANACAPNCAVAMLNEQGASRDTSAAVRYFKQIYWKG